MRGARRERRVGLADGPVVAIGLAPRPLSDLYHFLLTSRWWQLLLLIAGAYVAVNALFALAYVELGDAIEHARPGSFSDAFFFSVQTMATVGYGNLWPRTTAANVLATAEVLVGGLGLALVTGLVFAKFARPTSRVVFSRVAVVRTWDGAPSLMFRMANARSSQIVEARVGVMLVRTERTAEGDEVRRLHDLALVRAQHALFALTWTAIHRIDAASPLRGADAASLAEAGAVIVVSFSGFDENLATTVHTRHSYPADEVLWGRRFADVLLRGPRGERFIDYRRFHDTEPEAGRGADLTRRA
ncbi:MAG TPA: ion channel [Anaeromyxobacter sp.]